jgi:hypothetical protein
MNNIKVFKVKVCAFYRQFILNALLTIMLLTTGCVDVPDPGPVGEGIKDIADEIGVSTDKIVEIVAKTLGTTEEIAAATLAELDAAIRTLDQNSAEWQDVLQTLQTNLTRDVQSTIQNEVTVMLKTSVASASASFRCNSEFIGEVIRRTTPSPASHL